MKIIGELVGRLFHFDEDVASMAISMDKVVFHQHGEESFGSNVGNQSIHVVAVRLIKAYCLPIDELLD